jgi:predicted NUDIX family NTP pyrophosphohydrolase
MEADLDPAGIRSNTFSIEWPPRSGRQQEFPEIDRATWFDIRTAKTRILKGQLPLLEQLVAMISARHREARGSL